MSYSCSPTPISYTGDEISRVSHIVSEIWRGTDRQQTTHSVTKTKGSDTKCASLVIGSKLVSLRNNTKKYMSLNVNELLTCVQSVCTTVVHAWNTAKISEIISCYLMKQKVQETNTDGHKWCLVLHQLQKCYSKLCNFWIWQNFHNNINYNYQLQYRKCVIKNALMLIMNNQNQM